MVGLGRLTPPRANKMLVNIIYNTQLSAPHFLPAPRPTLITRYVPGVAKSVVIEKGLHRK